MSRLSVCCDLSCHLSPALAQGDLDVVLLKREPGAGPCIAAWAERLHWTGPRCALPAGEDTIRLVVRPAGCLYRERAIHALERAGRRWRIVYESPNLSGIQRGALRGGLGISLLDEQGLEATSTVLDDVLPAIVPTELALITRLGAPDGAHDMAGMLRRFCDGQRTRAPAAAPQAAATTGMGKPLAAEPL